MAVCTEGDFGWFESRDGWREVWGPPRTMQSLIFRILRGCNGARVDLHHQAARERDLDYHIARNIVEAFLASGWTPPAGVRPQLHSGEGTGDRTRSPRRRDSGQGE
jgi:hypothetical protein